MEVENWFACPLISNRSTLESLSGKDSEKNKGEKINKRDCT